MSLKKEYVMIAICFVLAVFITGGVAYLVVSNVQNKVVNEETTDKDNNTNNNEEEKLIDGVKFVNATKQNNEIRENFEVIIDGQKHDLELNFLYNNENDMERVLGYFGDYEVYLNSNDEITDSSKDKIFNVDVIKKEFTKDNFKFIEGNDGKKYLLIIGNSKGLFADNLYVFNDKLELISKDIPSIEVCSKDWFTIQSGYTFYELENGVSPWYQDTLNVCDSKETCNVVLKIENNKIYYLAPIVNFDMDSSNTDVLEERIYTINNDVLNYEVINKYVIVNGSGNMC